jgi:hypothetical protein
MFNYVVSFFAYWLAISFSAGEHSCPCSNGHDELMMKKPCWVTVW